MDKVTIMPDDVSWSGEDRVVIRNTPFLQALVEEGKGPVLQAMADAIAIPTGALSIDEHGDIVIKDKATRQVIESAFTSHPGGLAEPTNHSVICGNQNVSYVCGSNFYRCGTLEEETANGS